MKSIVWIIPWFHENVGGGSEVKVREYAQRLIARGDDVEVWCTCGRDFHDNWNVDHWPVGLSDVLGIPTRRFPIRKGNHTVYNELNARLLAGGTISEAEGEAFFRESINSDALMDHIRTEGRDRHLIFTPYMYGTTFNGSQIFPKTSFIYSEFHNEPYVRIPALKKAVEGVAGIFYHSTPERELANSVFNIAGKPQAVLGMGIEELAPGDVEEFRRKSGLGDDPFILYAGRQSAAKGVGVLCDFFREFRHANSARPLKLVLIGKEDMEIPKHPDILPLGFVSEEDKVSAHRAATVLCQPSVNESFSIVVLESWMVGVPVLVNGWCAVTKNHCEISGGGLWFDNQWEFREAMNWLLDHPEERRRMAKQGEAYVRTNLRWDVILDRFERFLEEREREEATV